MQNYVIVSMADASAVFSGSYEDASQFMMANFLSPRDYLIVTEQKYIEGIQTLQGQSAAEHKMANLGQKLLRNVASNVKSNQGHTRFTKSVHNEMYRHRRRRY